MLTFEEVARSALAAVDCDASYVLASQWAVERYQQLCSRVRFRHQRVLGTVVVPAAYSTGTVTTVRDMRTVIGVGTAWTASLQGLRFRGRVNWYQIRQVNSATVLTLDTVYAEDGAADAGYFITSQAISLDPDARWISNTVVHARMRRPLDGPYAMSVMGSMFPERLLVGGTIIAWGQTEDTIDINGQSCLSIEVYPYPTQSEALTYIMWKAPEAFKPENAVPRVVDLYQLKAGALIDVLQYNASKAANAGKVDVAGYWRNESRSQSTTWERVILDVAKNDKGADDLHFILAGVGNERGWGTAITDAHSEVYSRGRRP